MRRVFCLLLVFVMMSSLCVQAFADGDVLYCRMCGKKIPIDSKVCSYCGEKVVLLADETQDKTPVSEPKPAGNDADTQAPSAEPAANPDTAAPLATDVKTALTQPNAGPSPVTSIASAPASNGAISPAAPAALLTPGFSRQVYVTKSPTSESVPYGGSCMFIAHAVNATSVTWYISSSDGSIVTAASDAPYSVSGLYVTGGNSDTLYLSGIPSWWNGCRVQACFTGEGGPVYSDIARIWTYQPAQAKDTGCRSWWDWFSCYYSCDPYQWDCPYIPSTDYDWIRDEIDSVDPDASAESKDHVSPDPDNPDGIVDDQISNSSDDQFGEEITLDNSD